MMDTRLAGVRYIQSTIYKLRHSLAVVAMLSLGFVRCEL